MSEFTIQNYEYGYTKEGGLKVISRIWTDKQNTFEKNVNYLN